MNGLREYVSASYPLPWTPVYDGMGEFVPGGYPLPQNPVYFPSAKGALPKAPPIPMAMIGSGGADSCGSGIGCDCGGSCGGCGMGDLMIGSTNITQLIPGTTFGVANTYLVAGVIAAALLFMGGSSRRRR